VAEMTDPYTSKRGRLSGNIRNRVTVATALVVGIALVMAGATLLIILQQLLVAGVDNALSSRARDLSVQSESATITGTISGTAGDTSLVQIVSSNGTVIASTSNVAGEAPILQSHPALRATATTTVSDSPLDTGTEFRVLAEPITLPDGPGWIYVASSLGQVTAAVNQVRSLFLAGLPVVLVVIAAIAWLSVRQSLKPVESIRRRAAEITAADLSQRVPVPRGSDEIAHLAQTVNDLLGRIEQAAIRQQQFVGDASHELRSPLAALQIQIDVALANAKGSDLAAELAPMSGQVNRMTMLIEDLLFLAKSTETRPMVLPALVDLDEIVFEEAARLRALGGPEIVTSVLSAQRVRGSFRDISRMMRNVGDNAHDHAKAKICLSLRVANTVAEIVVSDDGAGVAQSDQERIFSRFSRLDGSRVRDSRGGGSGLGLSIARQIAESAAGSLSVRDRSDGKEGAEFVIRLPVAQYDA
jgi:signal transduction histidine kinase